MLAEWLLTVTLRVRLRPSAHCVSVEGIANERVIVDGFNLMITVEAGLSAGPLLLCRDELYAGSLKRAWFLPVSARN